MRRAWIGTLAGWLAGAAGLVAQSPMQMPSPYSTYAPAAVRGPYYDPAMYGPQYGPMGAPSYGPMPAGYGPGPGYGPAYGPSYGPVMNAGGMQPPGAATP